MLEFLKDISDFCAGCFLEEGNKKKASGQSFEKDMPKLLMYLMESFVMLKIQGSCRMRFYLLDGAKNPQKIVYQTVPEGMQPTEYQPNVPSAGYGVLELQNSSSLPNIQQLKGSDEFLGLPWFVLLYFVSLNC